MDSSTLTCNCGKCTNPSHVPQPGASTVKWTNLDPCLMLSESDSKLYTNFEFGEEKE